MSRSIEGAGRAAGCIGRGGSAPVGIGRRGAAPGGIGRRGAASGGIGRRGAASGALAAALALALAGCSPVVTTHGYAPAPARLAELAPGLDTPASVAAKIGRPSTGGVIRDDAWYYVASRMETLGWRAPEATERRVVVVRFDAEGFVAGVDEFGLEDGRIINLVTRTTPTFGRELTALQQIFGNLGNVGAGTAERLTE